MIDRLDLLVPACIELCRLRRYADALGVKYGCTIDVAQLVRTAIHDFLEQRTKEGFPT